MLSWFKRRATPVPAAPAATFDVSIDFDPADLGVTADGVRAAAQTVPGAGWVSVEPHAGAGLEVRLFETGSGVEAVGAAWDTVRCRIEAAVRGVATGWNGQWAEPAPVQAGFAESAAQFEALEQLSALATLQQTQAALAQRAVPAPAGRTPPVSRPKRKPTPPPPVFVPTPEPVALPVGDEDVFRLSRLLALVLPVDGRAQAAAAVRRFGSFAAVLAAPEAELRRVPGFGVHSIAAVKLIHAAAIRHARAGIAGRPVLDDRQRLADYLSAALARERVEQFRILFLDADGMLKADEVQAQGTVNHTPVYPREVVRRALALGASSLILVHNHPSGDPAPSRDDVDMTRQVRQAAAVLGIELRDHVIIGNGRWLSFRDEGLLA